MMKKMLSMILLVILLGVAMGCRDKDVSADHEAFRTRAETEAQNRELAKRYVETLNDGNFDAFKELLSPDYAIYSPSGYPKPTSREKLIENYQRAREAFSEYLWSIEDLIAAGDKVVCRVMARGTYKGGIPGLPLEETKFEFGLISIMRMNNGKVVEEWQEDDQLGFARQLGMELRQKETKRPMSLLRPQGIPRVEI